jgi:DUF1680 family protein
MREQPPILHDFAIDFEITVDQPIDFVLKLRKPSWTKSIKLNVPFADMGKVICIDKRWTGVEKIRLELEPILEINETPGEVYFTYGPLVLANPIEAIETKTRAYGLTEFCDVQYKPAHLSQYEYRHGSMEKKEDDLSFYVELFNLQKRKNEKLLLVPMGKTILRQVSFKNA